VDPLDWPAVWGGANHARLLPTDYVLVILNNDRSEFGLRFVYNFGL
jgi:hypothetical protein